MKVLIVTVSEVAKVLRLHGMTHSSLSSEKVRRGLNLFTGAKLMHFDNRWGIVSFKPFFADVVDLGLGTDEEIRERLIKQESLPSHQRYLKHASYLLAQERERIQKCMQQKREENDSQWNDGLPFTSLVKIPKDSHD